MQTLCCPVCGVVWPLVWASSPSPPLIWNAQHGNVCWLMWMSSKWIFLTPALIQPLSFTASASLRFCFIVSFFQFFFCFFLKGLRETTLHRKTSFSPKSSFKGNLNSFSLFVCLYICELLIECWICHKSSSSPPWLT